MPFADRIFQVDSGSDWERSGEKRLRGNAQAHAVCALPLTGITWSTMEYKAFWSLKFNVYCFHGAYAQSKGLYCFNCQYRGKNKFLMKI